MSHFTNGDFLKHVSKSSGHYQKLLRELKFAVCWTPSQLLLAKLLIRNVTDSLLAWLCISFTIIRPEWQIQRSVCTATAQKSAYSALC